MTVTIGLVSVLVKPEDLVALNVKGYNFVFLFL